ncbi:hypothetical protein FI667_g4511, partial [Globisporangium splendens]
MDPVDPDWSADERRNYAVTLLKCMWGRSVRISKEKSSEDAMDVFLDDPQCSVLQARVLLRDAADNNREDQFDVILSNQLRDAGTKSKYETVFVKVRPVALMPDNMSTSIQVTSVMQSPLQSLYQAVHQVYAPMLLKNDANASQLSQKLKDILIELDTGMGSAMLSGDGSSSSVSSKATGNDGDAAALMNIVTINDEFQYWERADQKNQKRAKKFCAAFDNIHQRYSNLETLTFDEMMEVLEESYNTLDDIWRADLSRENQYPQPRMNHLLGLVGSAINTFILEKANALNVWTGNLHDVTILLQQSIALCEKWTSSIDTLTETMWPSYDEHPWVGKKSDTDVPLQALIKRMEEILRICTTYEELISLLPRAMTHKLSSSCFQPFAKLKPLYYNPYTEQVWQKAAKEYESTFAPVETQVGAILREQTQHCGASLAAVPQPVTASFARQGARGRTRRIAGAASDAFGSARERFRDAATAKGKGIPYWENAEPQAKHVLADLPAFKQFAHQCEQLLAKVNGMVLDKVRDWQEQIENQLEQEGEDSLRLSGKLMQIDKNGDLIVNYSELLVTLLRDVRQLTELSALHGSTSGGAKKDNEWVPPKVRKVAEEAEKYYRYARSLRSKTHAAGLAFEEAVKRPGLAQQKSSSFSKKDVTWQNLEECNEYVKQLQDAADKLSSENRRFKRAHEKLSEEFLALMDIDLLRYPTKWKERWDDIKKTVLAVTKKQDPARTKKWFLYWDHQLYKVLESGYQMGLEMLNENLPEIKDIKTELHFPLPSSSSSAVTTNGPGTLSLLLKPPIEELRTTYYKAMKKFVSRPTKFNGFANPQVFAAMCDANANNLVLVYQSCEQLFTLLESLLYEYEHWSLLSRMGSGSSSEFESLMESELHEPMDWEINLKTVKMKRKEAEKIPDFLKIDCIHVSLVPLKSTLDEYLQRFQDGLLLSLRKSTLAHLRIVEEFVETAKEKLNTRPHSIEEISHAQIEWKEIDTNKTAMHAHFEKAEKKKVLLLTVLGASASSKIDTHEVESRLAKLPTEWENFEVSHEAFNEMIEDQRESLKCEIEAQVVQCNEAIDKFRERWTGLRLLEVSSWQEDDLAAKVYKPIEDETAKLSELKTRSETLTASCNAFSMAEPMFDDLATIDASVSLTVLNWSTYKQFCDEIKALAAQDWITFSANVFALQDCAQKWVETAKQSVTERTMAVNKIQDFQNHVKRAMPTLKLCHGEPFKDDHWT